MALTRNDNFTPEENLLRLIEKPNTGEQTLVDKESVTIVLGKKKGLGVKALINSLFTLPVMFLGVVRNISLKTVNRLCMIMITVLLGYAIWSVVSAEQLVISEPKNVNSEIRDIIQQSDIDEYYGEINKRNIFMDMYKPPVIEIVKPASVPTSSGPTPVVEAKPPISSVLKNLKLIGITWEPQSFTSGLVLIDNGSDVLCLARGDTFKINVEQSGNIKNVNIEIKEISKDKVTLRYESEEVILMLTDK